MTKDKIFLVESEDEVSDLGWTCLGPVPCKKCKYSGIAWLWCKKDKFVLLDEKGEGKCGFVSFVTRDEGLLQLCEYKKNLVKIKEE